jgi:hypothetical protein
LSDIIDEYFWKIFVQKEKSKIKDYCTILHQKYNGHIRKLLIVHKSKFYHEYKKVIMISKTELNNIFITVRKY